MNKIKKFFMNLWYGLPHGIKAANIEIMGGGDKDDLGSTINQEVSDERVAKHLLKGEITQEVEELRYRTYKVADESENYKYLGNGVAIKEEKNEEPQNRKKYRFSQDNENICESVLSGLKQVGDYGVERYRFEIGYSSLVRFKVEKFATSVDVNIDEDNEIVETTLHFSSEPNPYDGTSMPFINELKRLMDSKSEYEINRNEIASSIDSLSFVTYKSNNESDLVTYSFMDGGKFKSIEKKGYEYLLTISWNAYVRLPIDLAAKYYSKTMDEKYKNKERKDVSVSLANVERKRYCSACGREMSVYDADIQEASGQEPICNECMKKALKK